MATLLATAVILYAVGGLSALMLGLSLMFVPVCKRDEVRGYRLVMGGFLVWPVLVVVALYRRLGEVQELIEREED